MFSLGKGKSRRTGMDPEVFVRAVFITEELSFELPFLRRLTQILQPRLMFYFNTNKPQSFFCAEYQLY